MLLLLYLLRVTDHRWGIEGGFPGRVLYVDDGVEGGAWNRQVTLHRLGGDKIARYVTRYVKVGERGCVIGGGKECGRGCKRR